jgi:hypothetical protein
MVVQRWRFESGTGTQFHFCKPCRISVIRHPNGHLVASFEKLTGICIDPGFIDIGRSF